MASGTAFATPGIWLAIDAAGSAELVQTSGAGTSTAIPIAGTPLRLAHPAGVTVAACTIKDMSPRSPYLSGG